MRHAITAGLRADDPTIGVRAPKYRSAGFYTWTEEDIAAFEARHPKGTQARLALALLLYTAQRRADVVRMGRQHVREGLLSVTQAKTGTTLAIPLHPELAGGIRGYPRGEHEFPGHPRREAVPPGCVLALVQAQVHGGGAARPGGRPRP